MKGEVIGKLVVVEEAPRVKGNPQWLCQCSPKLGGCGEFEILPGINLRDRKKYGSKTGCLKCRPKTRGIPAKKKIVPDPYGEE